jgi:DNA polymerase
MPDPRLDLADLVSDTLAALHDAIARGVEFEGPSAPLPEPAPEPARPVDPGWANIAAAARARADAAVAHGAGALEAIRADLGDCRRCGLCTGRTQLVFGVGDPEADLVIVGEAPGQQEDLRGEPFVGPAGEMLDRMLINVLGLRRDQVYIANVVKCRPPGNRNPLPDEIATCRPFLEAQIRALRPKLMLVLGSVALQALFTPEARITRDRGKWRDWAGIPAIPTFHPAYLLRKPEDKRFTFEDLKALRARYDELGGRR